LGVVVGPFIGWALLLDQWGVPGWPATVLCPLLWAVTLLVLFGVCVLGYWLIKGLSANFSGSFPAQAQQTNQPMQPPKLVLKREELDRLHARGEQWLRSNRGQSQPQARHAPTHADAEQEARTRRAAGLEWLRRNTSDAAEQ